MRAETYRIAPQKRPCKRKELSLSLAEIRTTRTDPSVQCNRQSRNILCVFIIFKARERRRSCRAGGSTRRDDRRSQLDAMQYIKALGVCVLLEGVQILPRNVSICQRPVGVRLGDYSDANLTVPEKRTGS